MEKLRYANSYKDLIVYQKAQSIAHKIFELTKTFPKEELYSLVDQIRRSSRSVGAQIAESWAKRRYVKHFISKLTDADGEQLETQHWVDTSGKCGYLKQSQVDELNSSLTEVGQMLNSMMNKADMFCNRTHHYTVSEDTPEYFTDN